jgi:hypothetical protein
MRFLHDDPNPLNVLEIRELNFCPKDWTSIKIGTNDWNIQRKVDECRQWIYNNLSGRFCIVSDTEIVKNKMEIVYKIGFEEASESTMFNLGCSVLHDTGPQF